MTNNVDQNKCLICKTLGLDGITNCGHLKQNKDSVDESIETILLDYAGYCLSKGNTFNNAFDITLTTLTNIIKEIIGEDEPTGDIEWQIANSNLDPDSRNNLRAEQRERARKAGFDA